MNSVITGWGMAVPQRVLTNADLALMVATSDEWIVSRTGIRERHIAGPGETAATLAVRAGQHALDRAGLTASEIDLLIVATVTGDDPLVATACIVQSELGAKGIAFDIQAACTGWLYAFVMAHQFIATASAKHALVIGVDVFSTIIDYTDRQTCVLFGDGAGAAVISATPTPGGILGWMLGADGARPEQLYCAAGRSRAPLSSSDHIALNSPCVQMMGAEVFKLATRVMGSAMAEALYRANLTVADIDLFIPHQANLRIIDAAAQRLNLPPEKVFVNIERYGNTSAASVPIALCEALDQGRVPPGGRLGLVAFGAGLTWGAVVLELAAAEP
jgi:3-oxoacyl-[acyl-carrier-protein] synthase III